MPKGVADLAAKISLNQGILSFYRGQSPLIVILSAGQLFRFGVYDKILE